jgi:hypothetical protein
VTEERRAGALLSLGVVGGIALAAFGIVRSGSGPGPELRGAVAVVNGQPISRETFARFTATVAAERKQTELDEATRKHLLERMIDEELLFQRGLALGLPRHEPTARRAVVAALVASISAEAEAVEPGGRDLRRFYDENRERFTRPGRLDVDLAWVATDGRPEVLAFRQAQEIARRARAGESFAALREELGDEPVAPLPGGALPFETLRQYLGPTLAQASLRLGEGEVAEPLRAGDGYAVLYLERRVPGEQAPFEEVREEVRREWLRERGDRALRDYVDDLRSAGDVRIFEEELAGS